MKTEKPKIIIELLNKLIQETDISKYEGIYIQIANETMPLEFEHSMEQPFKNIIYKKLIQLSVKEFIYLGQTSESLLNLKEVIDILESTLILSR